MALRFTGAISMYSDIGRLASVDSTLSSPHKSRTLYIQNSKGEIYTCSGFLKESCGKLPILDVNANGRALFPPNKTQKQIDGYRQLTIRSGWSQRAYFRRSAIGISTLPPILLVGNRFDATR